MAQSQTPSERGGQNLEIATDDFDFDASIRKLVADNPAKYRIFGVPPPEELYIKPGPGERLIYLSESSPNPSRHYTTIVDAEDYERLIVHKWSALVQKKDGKVYAIRMGKKSEGPQLFRTTVYMHREIVDGGRRKKSRILPSNRHVDHKNGNSLDNRRGNFKPGEPKFNHMSRHLKKKSKSGFRGVTPVTGYDEVYQARIRLDGKAYYLGTFDGPVDAALAYDKKARQLLRGLDPRFLKDWLNFPDFIEIRAKKRKARPATQKSAEAGVPF